MIWLLVLLLAGCATANPMGHEGPAARRHRDAFATCQKETRAAGAKLVWMAPDGNFKFWAPTREEYEAIKQCMTEVAGTRWVPP